MRSEEGDAAENEDEDFEGSQIHVAKVEFTSSQFKNASNYDIIPFFASPHGVSINALSATPGMQFIFTGGADGFVRKYDFLASIAGELPLTLNQKHSFTDSITKVQQYCPSYATNYYRVVSYGHIGMAQVQMV